MDDIVSTIDAQHREQLCDLLILVDEYHYQHNNIPRPLGGKNADHDHYK